MCLLTSITSWTALRNLSYGNFAPQRNMCPCIEWRHVLILATYDMTTYWFDSPSNNWTPDQCWAKSSFIPEKKQISNGVLCASKAFLFLTQLKQFWNAVIFCVVHPVISKADPKALRTYRNCQAVVLFSTSCSLRLRVQPLFGVQPLTSTLQDLASLPPSLRHSWPLASLPPSCKPPWLGPALEGYHIHLQVGPQDVFLLPFRPLGSWWAWLLASWKPIHVEVGDWPLSWPLPWKLKSFMRPKLKHKDQNKFEAKQRQKPKDAQNDIWTVDLSCSTKSHMRQFSNLRRANQQVFGHIMRCAFA